MATGGDSTPVQAETLDCPVCSEQFLIPRRLPCLHTICEKCLETLINQQGRCGQCPLCKEQIAPPDTTISKDKWTSAFPLNELIQSLIESQNKCNQEENYCEPCRGKEKVPAEFWCITCQETLCNSCNDYHALPKVMKHHKTVPINEMGQNIQHNITFDQNCSQHLGHKLEIFCVTHRALCCCLCTVTIHRECDDIRDLNAVAKDQAKRCNYSDVIKEICQIKIEMDEILADKMDNRSQIKTEQEQIIKNMDIRIDQIIENLNALRVSFKNETENLYKETNNSIDKSEEQIKCFKTTITNAEQILESLQGRITSREKFIVLETLRSQVMSHYEQLKLSTQNDVEIHFSLKANTALCDIERLSSLGAVQTSSKQPKNRLKTVDDIMKKLSSMSRLSTTLSRAQIAKPMTSHVTFVKAVKTKKYGRRTLFGGDDNTWFTGGTVLPDGRLLMADWNNKRLVELDEQYNMVKDYKLDGDPTDVAAGQTNDELYMAVCEGPENYVYKCRLDTGLTVVSRIKAPSRTGSIAVSGDSIIVGTYDAVVILNQDGTTVKSIPNSGTEGIAVSGDNIIVGTYDAVVILNQDGTTVKSIPTSGVMWNYVAVSQTQRTMYHGDNQDVVCRTLEGSELFRYRHQQLKAPRGICIDTRGRAYICGQYSHNIHQVSPDGKTSTILELHTISRPYFCVFLPQRNELLVTSYSEDTALEVYKLE